MRVLTVGLVALLACVPSAAWAGGTRDAVPTVQDTVRRDTTTRRTPAPADTIRLPGDTIRRRPPADSVRAPTDTAGNLAGALPPGFEKLDLRLNSRLEAKGEQVTNDRCGSSQLFATAFRCTGTFQPAFDFQFNLLTRGTVADRIHVDVDYDTQREFDASNNISIRYEGKESELFQRVEVGNVSFAPPTSRFMTSGIPSGNYGLQALGRVGPMRFAAIAAQQKGNLVQDREFIVGDRTVQQQSSDIEDYQIEPRRFFFTVDPATFGAFYPNVDILNRRQLSAIADALPDSVRPSKVFVYRLLLGGQPRNPNGPQFRIIGDPTSQRGQVYELLRERVDYYIDPSLLWFALVTPLSQNSERLVVAYNVRINGRDTTIATTGGTPDLEFVPERDQLANLVWDPRLTPDDPAFRREIRSVYRIGGTDVRRQTVQVRIVTGGSADQEKPSGGGAETYIQHFRIAEATNNARFDADNRLWPRPNDPNQIVAQGGGADEVIRDYFLIFPSLQPFARAGLAGPLENPANDTIYRTPGEYLYSSRHPQSFYRLRVNYESLGDEVGAIALNAVQLRQGSERIAIDGRQLVRGVDYDIDYELGRVTFTRPDTLFPFPRRVRVSYEENPLFTTIPTSIFGLTTQFVGEHGALNFTAISQSQRTAFTRPVLGYEPASSLTAGVSGAFLFDASPLGRFVGRSLPFRDSLAGRATIALEGEFAVSRPRPNSKGQAYIETFDGEGGITVSLTDNAWYFGSRPGPGARLPAGIAAGTFDLARATTLAWQTSGTDVNSNEVRFAIEHIDPQTNIVGGVSTPETLLWLTLYPLSVGGQRDPVTGAFRWTVANTLPGQRWRSIRTSLGASGADLTGVETIEFWTLIDTSAVRRNTNPILMIDVGDVSENSVAFAPETLTVVNREAGVGTGAADSTYVGKKLQGYGRLDSERDQFSRAFNVDVNDTGLPGDAVDTLVVFNGGIARADTGVRVCVRGDIRLRSLGDSRTNCTVANSRLDEEDLDADNALRGDSDERLLRYFVDLTDSTNYNRRGQCGARVNDPNGARPPESTLCWVHIRLPFAAATDTINGGPLVRRVQALRFTAISPSGAGDAAFITTAIARLRLVGAPWLKRSSKPLTGAAGDREQAGGGYVIAGVIGTDHRDATRGLIYEPPPGISDAPDNLQAPFDPTRVQINERSLRLQAGGLAQYDRAEAFLRFPEGQKSFMSYKELRVWTRGRGNGWGPDGELQFFIKIGRDPNNFYMYRVPASAGATRAAWEPEVRVVFQKFFALRSQLEGAYLRGSADSLACSGVDSVLIARSGLPAGAAVNRFAACDGGYMVYTTDPAVAPPNLASVQELAVGMVRVDSATGATPLAPTDTMEVWVDDIRLTDVVDETGFAGQFGVSVALGDLGTLRIAATRRDPNFRQLGESPSFAMNNDLAIATTVRLDQFLPPRLGIALPFTVAHTRATVDPTFLAQSDVFGDEIAGLRSPRSSATTYALSARRTAPLRGRWYAPIVNHLGVTGTYNTLGNRSEFQDGQRHRFTLSGDYFVTLPVAGSGPGGGERGLSGLMPSWLSTSGQAPGAFNLRPTSFRVTSGLTRDSERRESFLKPAVATDDSGRVATGESDLWRNAWSLELQPVPHLTARADAVSLRDLRQYDAATPNGAAASDQRETFLGLDTGLERERQLASSLTYTPVIAEWLRPRLDVATGFSLLRDPNAPLAARDRPPPAPGGGVEPPQLALRLGNTRTITAGAGIDLAKAATRYRGPASLSARVARYLQPIDVSFTRGILSSFDATTESPGLGYQLGIGGINGVRELGGQLANSAGATSQVALSTGLNLPLDVSLTNRLQRTTTRNWAQRLESEQTTIDGDQVVYPDLNVRWAPAGPLFGGLVKAAGANGRLLHTRQSLVVPAVMAGARSEQRATTVKTYPLNASLTWGPGEITTTGGYSYRTQVDSLPGSVTNGSAREMSAEVGRTFGLPVRWELKSGLRARLGFQQTQAQSYVQNLFAAGSRSRLTDNGRQAFTLNADTDVAENATFSIQGSRIVNFDRNLNRRLTQTVVTAVLQMQFFAGDLR